ncbi:DUF202 domain-containing protein [Streptomyces sp. M41]|uniref:DUF202 domain-containing protein n=1 Tax=Streptomyces sp. M41 TaxID=3059412 RepID=UPI00374CAFEE
MSAGPVTGPVRDPGLQPERTRLAWRRTTLSGAVVCVLAMKSALHDGASVAGIVVCALCLGLWLGFLTLAHRRIRTLSASAEPTALAPRLATATTLLTLTLAACGAAVVF